MAVSKSTDNFPLNIILDSYIVGTTFFNRENKVERTWKTYLNKLRYLERNKPGRFMLLLTSPSEIKLMLVTITRSGLSGRTMMGPEVAAADPRSSCLYLNY